MLSPVNSTFSGFTHSIQQFAVFTFDFNGWVFTKNY